VSRAVSERCQRPTGVICHGVQGARNVMVARVEAMSALEKGYILNLNFNVLQLYSLMGIVTHTVRH
jgi:hypothetical protein